MRLDTDIHRAVYQCAHNHLLAATLDITTTSRCEFGIYFSNNYPRSKHCN